ncbi:MAG: hypothetical protein IK990_00125 [Ruminiclostridium sp.]|nr:hypothetical protein [Ruminiclostridium sp.]
MTDYSMKCGHKSAREYVMLRLTGTSLKQSLPMIVCASMLTALPLLGIIGWIMTQNTVMLVLTICALVVDAGIILFLHITINSTAEKLAAAHNKQDGLVCAVSEKEIVIVHDNRPVRVIGWDKLTSAQEGKTAFFLREGDDRLIILDKSEVLSGSVRETSEIIAKVSENRK